MAIKPEKNRKHFRKCLNSFAAACMAILILHVRGSTVGKSDEHSAPEQRAWVRGSPGKTPPYSLMAPGACTIWVQCPPTSHPNYTSEGTNAGEPSPPWKIKIVMACLRTILRDESQAIGNSPIRSSSPILNPSNEPTSA